MASKLLLYTKPCTVCGKQFSYHAYISAEKKQPRKTCSKTCQYSIVSKALYNRVKRQCKWCKKPYSTIACQNKTFCSRECQIQFMKSLTGDKNPAWKPINEKASYRTLKTTIRKRLITSETTCYDCGKKSLLFEIHHVDKNRKNNNLSNLVVLCLDCHANRHRGEQAERIIRGSKNHSKMAHRPMTKCKFCKKKFLKYNDHLMFCSRRCSKLYRDSITPSTKTTSYCQQCGKSIIHIPAIHPKFCSRACTNLSHQKTR
jgi:hypothetical protein